MNTNKHRAGWSGRLSKVVSFLTHPVKKIAASVSLATGLYGISFGALSVASGLSVLQTVALSLLMFTGGSQFAFIGVIGTGGAGSTAVGASTLLGVRNAVYGMQNNVMLNPFGSQRFLAAHLTIDESTAVSASQVDPEAKQMGFWYTGWGVFICWNLFTLLGAVLGERLGDPQTLGLDGAAVAAFLGLLWSRLRSAESVALAVACGLLTATVIPVLPPGTPILVTAAFAALWGILRKRAKF
ncbi:AzlC family ABC transporter permease [Arcanobacterium ihumii]|uniref:AzlC family ABC transporter permease n=1 Tax=Arcanobacterium ihumii TaxID=2138162 RepID=UPI000F5430D3|nr:AzlC family ABC transporter permease [Arcanobacterium ihumii]